MKKILFCFVFLLWCGIAFAAPPEPTKKVMIIYRVTDTVLQCQNAEEDIIKGKAELEEELVKHYSKRFVVQGIERGKTPDVRMPISFYQEKVKPGQTPLIITLLLNGQGQSATHYQNAFGATAIGIAPAVSVSLIELLIDQSDLKPYSITYGPLEYSAGTFAVGRNIYAAQTDPRKNAKNALRGIFRDACKLNEDINKYANPVAYEYEYNRFIGDFKKAETLRQKTSGTLINKIEKFEIWCKSNETNKVYLEAINALGNNLQMKVEFINTLITMGVYKDN